VIVKLTGIVMVVGVAARSLTTILLVYVPWDNVFVATLAEMVPVAVPLDGLICSQLPPVTGVTDAVNPELPPVAVKVMVWAAGAVVAPWAWVNESEVGDETTVVFAETVRITGIISDPLGSVALLFAEMVIDPV
jgi:hypothetical protein